MSKGRSSSSGGEGCASDELFHGGQARSGRFREERPRRRHDEDKDASACVQEDAGPARGSWGPGRTGKSVIGRFLPFVVVVVVVFLLLLLGGFTAE